MIITNAEYNEYGHIIVTVDDVKRTITNTTDSDRFFAELQKQKIVITDYKAPPPTSHQVNTECHRRQYLPVTVTVSMGTADEKTFPVDMDNGGRENLGDLVLMAMAKTGAGITTNFNFRDADNNNQVLTNAEMIQMGMYVGNVYSAIFEKSLLLKAADPMPDDITDDSHWV